MTGSVREALAALARALPLVLFRAGIFVAAGFAVIILFGMLLVAARLAAGSGTVVMAVLAPLAALGWWAGGRVLRRFFLYRHRAALLLAFSGRCPATAGLAGFIAESKGLVPDYPRWQLLNRDLRRSLAAFGRGGGPGFQIPPAMQGAGGVARVLDRLAAGWLGQAVLALAYARGGADGARSVREGLALVFAHGADSRRLARQWLVFSASAQLFLFLCLAVPNWIFFTGAGAPLWIGVVLAAAIARLLHQAFIAPLVLAGVSAALLAETRGKVPDPETCDKLAELFPGIAVL